MVEIDVKNIDGQVINKLEVDETKIPVKGTGDNPLYFYVKAYLANQRSGTACTKTRGEVSGGGRKPWRQKGTGRARVGSIRSPLWRGGGVVFGPKPRDFSEKITKSLKLSAYRAALKRALVERKIILIDEIALSSHKTKEMIKILTAIGIDVGVDNCLFVVSSISNELYLASRNIPDLWVLLAKDVNPYDLLWAKRIVVVRDAWDLLWERINRKRKGLTNEDEV